MTFLTPTIVCGVGLFLCFHLYEASLSLQFHEERKVHASKSLTSSELVQLSSLYNETYIREALNQILVPRVVGTPSHERVKEFIGSQLQSFGYDVEYDTFDDNTPTFGKLRFTNIIAKLDPTAPRFLTLACHYDSKYFKEFEFLGATDSAVPCAMLMELAKVLTPLIRIQNPRVSLMLIFFDGEEAFRTWSSTDSIYGSRHLAKKMSRNPYPTKDAATSELNRIDMLVLLDLMGSKDTKFYSFFPETEQWHRSLAHIEQKLKSLGQVASNQPLHFLEKSTFGYIEDDHIPFLQQGVPILHLIPVQFPSVWHTEKDDYSVLDFPTIETLNKVLVVFTYAYLHGNLDFLPN
ncbi:glutaminyl-peptide cyclotransferase [Halyomorpha halys]|uniref:glutaminyl-peptide cyclotransferase n=1 Tax=Halyomorpha halys TaxID=286706 RepID=UPI0006D4C745|nr:glutaminyl-peptide cyclotransferase [Halyomorpha halys]